jgi:hypothetical protein
LISSILYINYILVQLDITITGLIPSPTSSIGFELQPSS